MSVIPAGEQLLSFVERIERMKEEQDQIASDVRDIYAEAKSQGFDKTALGEIVTIRRKKAKDPEAFAEKSSIVDLYMEAIDDAAKDRSRGHTHAREKTRPTAPPYPASPVAGPGKQASDRDPGVGHAPDHSRNAGGGARESALVLGQSGACEASETGGEGGRKPPVDPPVKRATMFPPLVEPELPACLDRRHEARMELAHV